MFVDLLVVGTSIASGVGRGPERTPQAGAVKSWIYHLADLVGARNVWNHSLPGKPLGLVNADAVEFFKQYYEKYRNFQNLFVILEYSFPSYKVWDPVASARNDCKGLDIIPVTHFKPFHQLSRASDTIYRHGYSCLENHFFCRKPVDLLRDTMHPHEIYHEVDQDDIIPEDLQRFQKQAVEWFEPTPENHLRYLRYAFDEILAAQLYFSDKNMPYVQSWVGGVSQDYKRGVDRFMRPLMQSGRLIPMQNFTAASASLEWSKNVWRNHPDEHGHRKIAEFYHDWITKHRLHERPNNKLYTGYTEDFRGNTQ